MPFCCVVPAADIGVLNPGTAQPADFSVIHWVSCPGTAVSVRFKALKLPAARHLDSMPAHLAVSQIALCLTSSQLACCHAGWVAPSSCRRCCPPNTQMRSCMSCSRGSVQPASSCCRCPGQSRQDGCGGLIRCAVLARWPEELCLAGHHGRSATAGSLLVRSSCNGLLLLHRHSVWSCRY